MTRALIFPMKSRGMRPNRLDSNVKSTIIVLTGVIINMKIKKFFLLFLLLINATFSFSTLGMEGGFRGQSGAKGDAATAQEVPAGRKRLPGYNSARQKVASGKACTNCRKAHHGCDSQRPCLRCVKGKKSDSCEDAPTKRALEKQPVEIGSDASLCSSPAERGPKKRKTNEGRGAPPAHQYLLDNSEKDDLGLVIKGKIDKIAILYGSIKDKKDRLKIFAERCQCLDVENPKLEERIKELESSENVGYTAPLLDAPLVVTNSSQGQPKALFAEAWSALSGQTHSFLPQANQYVEDDSENETDLFVVGKRRDEKIMSLLASLKKTEDRLNKVAACYRRLENKNYRLKAQLKELEARQNVGNLETEVDAMAWLSVPSTAEDLFAAADWPSTGQVLLGDAGEDCPEEAETVENLASDHDEQISDIWSTEAVQRLLDQLQDSDQKSPTVCSLKYP